MKSRNIFSISVGGTSELECSCCFSNVGCKISIINDVTGDLIHKSSKDRKVFSANESTSYISSCTTKTVKSAKFDSPVFYWNETIFYNEDFQHIYKSDNIIIFEIIDYTLYEGQKGFINLAWGFLRLNEKNINKQRTLQLYKYPKNFKQGKNKIHCDIFDYFKTKEESSCLLSVLVSTVVPKEPVDVYHRPKFYYEIERGKQNIEILIEKGNEIVDIDIDNSERSDIGVNVKSKIPNIMKTQIYPGENGALFLKFNHSGSLLAATIQKGQDFCIDIYDTDNFKLVLTLHAHLENIYELEFSRNDQKILSVSGDCMAKVWNIHTKNAQILPHTKYVYSGKFHPLDNNFVFTAGYDAIIRVWNLEEGKLIKELHGHQTQINSIVFSPNGKRLFCGDNSGVISVWKTNLDKGGIGCLKCKQIVVEDEILNVPITCLEMVRSNLTILVQTQDDIIRVFDTKAMTTAQRYVGTHCKNFILKSTFSPDGAYVLSGSEDGSIHIWSVKMAKSIHINTWNKKFDHPVTAVAWNPIKNMITFSSYGGNQPILVFVAEQEY